mmetsp:Transcript_25339/g.45705  ORF Transcript_25339/g.45705 Transcript_25339/m.45705 type:complete len:673 (-) Transcript_25339:178-2196(-)
MPSLESARSSMFSLRDLTRGRSGNGGSGTDPSTTPRPTTMRGTISNYSGPTYRGSDGDKTASMMKRTSSVYMPVPRSGNNERLHQIVVFELREDGATEYSTMTLRALYNYVVRTITEACRQANSERHQHNRQPSSSQRHTIHNGRDGVRQRDIFSGIIDNGNAHDGTDIGVIEEEVDHDGNSPNPTTPSFPYPPTTPSNIPPHLPSLTSSNATPSSDNRSSLPTPITSNQSIDNNTPHDSNDEDDSQHQQQSRQPYQYSQHHQQQQRETQTTRVWCKPLNNGNTHRERLGGYLHPRDMRRLVTPFSSSNEPQLMVRRHVMLLNFDPLRAIVLKDRLLVLVPDGADSILIELEKRVRGGIAEYENQVFGSTVHDDGKMDNSQHEANNPGSSAHSDNINSTEHTTNSDEQHSHSNSNNNDEWEVIEKMDWTHMPYELQSVDAVLQTVTHMLMNDAHEVHHKSARAMSELRGEEKAAGGKSAALGEHAQERLRLHKDEVNLMEGRVQGFVRAMNEVLDDDEDMTLMNLSRLLTHPERFLQPVSQEILHEESDEPELILEAYLQQALSIVNELDLLKGQIMTTEEQISMTLDAIRNRLLYINTLLSVASLCVALGSFIGSLMGMNLKNHIESDDTAFVRVTVGVIVGMFGMWGILSWIFYRAANIHSDWGSKKKTS